MLLLLSFSSFFTITWSKEISETSRPIFTEFSDLWFSRYVAVDVRSGIGFAIGQGTLLWQPIFGAKSAEIGDTPSFLGVAFYKGRQDGKADRRIINTLYVLSTMRKNLVNFGPLTPEFTVTIWQPLRRQMSGIGETPTITVAFLDRFLPKVTQKLQPPKVITSSLGVKIASPFLLCCPSKPQFRGGGE